jgi:hypothetical protein
MRLKIIATNFTTEHEWIFKLVDENNYIFYIMDDPFYKKHNLKSPITKKELDYYDKGQWINAYALEIENKNIVIKYDGG